MRPHLPQCEQDSLGHVQNVMSNTLSLLQNAISIHVYSLSYCYAMGCDIINSFCGVGLPYVCRLKGPFTIINVLKFQFLFQVFCTHPLTPNFDLENIDLTDRWSGMQQGVLQALVAAIFKTVPNNWQEPEMCPKGFGCGKSNFDFQYILFTHPPTFSNKNQNFKTLIIANGT